MTTTEEVSKEGSFEFKNESEAKKFMNFIRQLEIDRKLELRTALTAQIEGFDEMIHLVQKQCAEADGTIDGITALHQLLIDLKAKLEEME